MLPQGCYDKNTQEFESKYKCTVIRVGDLFTIRFPNISCTLLPMYGDCTAATLYSNQVMTKRFVNDMLPAVIEYMSLNGRITLLFSRKHSSVESVQAEITELKKKFNVIGLHVNISNRSPYYYMLTGIIKITNPLVAGRYGELKEYLKKESKPQGLYQEFIDLNKSFGLTV